MLFASALLVRVAVSAELGNTPLFRTPELDSREYWNWAERIASGRFEWPVPPAHGPGYPFFLGALLALFDGSSSAARLCQAALGALLVVVVARIGERTFGRTAGLAAGALLALCGPLVLTEVSILSEGLLLLLIALAFLVSGGDGRPAVRAAFAGGLLGLAAIVRPTALLFFPALIVRELLRGKTRRASGAVRAALVTVACALPILPVAVANARATERPVVIQGHGGMNFYIGNSPIPPRDGLPSVRPGEAWDVLEAEGTRAAARGPADADRYYYRKTFREIGRAPLAWLRLFRSESKILALLPGFGLLCPLAALGLFAAATRRPGPAVVLAADWLVTAFATCVLLVVGSRYRLPLAPPAALFAGAGIAAAIRAGSAVRLRPAVSSTLLVAVAVLCHLRIHEPSHVFAEEWSLTGSALNHEGKVPEALKAFDRAIAQDPRAGGPHSGRGTALLNEGRSEEAIAELTHAVDLEPGSRAAQVELGIALERTNRAAEAEPHYRAALRLDPNDPATRETLGKNLLRLGRSEEAVHELASVVALVPDNARARLWLARAYGAAGRPLEGLPHARLAAKLGLPDGEAWLTAAMLAISSHDLTEAETDVTHAEAAGSPPRDTAMARAVIFRAERRLDRADGILRPLVLADPDFRPAVELFLENARERGAEREADDFLRRATQRASG